MLKLFKAKNPNRARQHAELASASNNDNNKFQGINLEAINASTGQEGEFSFLHAIFEMKKIFDYFSKFNFGDEKIFAVLRSNRQTPLSVKGNDRPNSAHGSGWLLRSSLKKYFSFSCPHPSSPYWSGETLVALTPNDQEPFMVASIYIPPNPNYRNLSADLDTLFKIFNTAIVAGDYNAKHTSWGCGSSDPRVANSTQEIDDQVSNLTTEILNAHASASRPFYQTERPYVQGELKG
ncbi:hypothetical protein TNCV_1784401 [Trichonephila clavipes]|nr:hypothetical protein TNCV_1784401 [Trichonephila clavipes]